MKLDGQAKKTLAEELAYHLSWEFWMADHALITQAVLEKIYPNGIPDEPPKETGQKIKTALRTWWEKYWKEKRTDTVAVGISRDGKEIVIAANLKKRSEKAIRKGPKGTTYLASEFSLHDGRHEEAIQRACETFPQMRPTSVCSRQSKSRMGRKKMLACTPRCKLSNMHYRKTWILKSLGSPNQLAMGAPKCYRRKKFPTYTADGGISAPKWGQLKAKKESPTGPIQLRETSGELRCGLEFKDFGC